MNALHHVATVVVAKGTGLGNFVPLGPNFNPLAPFAGMYKTLAGLGMAIAILAGVAGIILGFIKFGASGSKRDGHEGAAKSVRNGAIAIGGAFLVGGALVALAGVMTAIH